MIIDKGDFKETRTWKSIDEFIEDQEYTERQALLNKFKHDKDESTRQVRALKERMVVWRDQLIVMWQVAKKQYQEKRGDASILNKKTIRAEDTELKRMMPEPLTSEIWIRRFYVTFQGEVQIEKTRVPISISKNKRARNNR